MPAPITEAELRAAERQLVTWSLLRPAEQMSPSRVDGIVRSTGLLTAAMARRELGEVDLTVRDLLPSDLPNSTSNTWVETAAGSANAWAQASYATGGQLADNSFVGIYGVEFLNHEDADAVYGSDKEIVSAMRIIIGGTRVAQWDLDKLFGLMGVAGTPSNEYGVDFARFKTGIAESPVIITQNKTLEIQFWEVTGTALDFIAVLLGVVVEPVGTTLNP